MPLLWRPYDDRRSLRARRRTARPALRCRERDLSDDCPWRLFAASIRRNFLFPAPCRFIPAPASAGTTPLITTRSCPRPRRQTPVRHHWRLPAHTNLRKLIFRQHRRATKSP
jgi:hypothetical protein